MRGLSLAVLLAGCGTELFALPFESVRDLGLAFDDLLGSDGAIPSNADLAGLEGGTMLNDLLGSDGVISQLPASCAQLGCVPTVNEGDVSLDSGDISGCHAYATLTISGVVTVTKSDSLGFAACAEHIIVGFSLSADGRGFSGSKGPGAGGTCGSGAGHGGAGADPGGCGGGGVYDDANLPRLPGSGGGSFGGVGSGGAGGGAIELAADRIDLVSIISARGANGAGAISGGGSGGSILIHAGTLSGGGQVRANGGDGFGLSNGGGGGGGRVAIYATTNLATLSVAADGGTSTTGAAGANGTVIKP